MSSRDGSSKDELHPKRRAQRAKVEDEQDEDSDLVAPPIGLIALFLVPILLLIVWAVAQGG